MTDNDKSGGIGIGSILWFLIIPFFLGYTAHGNDDKFAVGLFMIIWVFILFVFCVIPIIGFPFFIVAINPILQDATVVNGLTGVFGTYLALYCWIYAIYTIIIAIVIVGVILSE